MCAWYSTKLEKNDNDDDDDDGVDDAKKLVCFSSTLNTKTKMHSIFLHMEKKDRPFYISQAFPNR